MQRIPPSEQIRKQLDGLLENGLAGQESLISTLVQMGAQLVVQELLERETTERLGRAHYQHRPPGEPLRGHRNGYEPGCLRTGEGDIPVKVPQVRGWVGGGPYRSELMTFLRGNSTDVFNVSIALVKRRTGAPFGDAILAGVCLLKQGFVGVGQKDPLSSKISQQFRHLSSANLRAALV